MSRSVAGKSGLASDVHTGSETAARLADYSGAQYIYIPGRSTVAAELSAEMVGDVTGLSLPADSAETHSADSGSERETAAGKDHRTDNPIKDPAKVSV